MIISYSKDLSEQEILAQGNELVNTMGLDRDAKGNRIHTLPDTMWMHVHTFKNPILVTDKVRIAQLEDIAVRESLYRLFEQPTVTTQYDGTEFTFTQSEVPSVWGPSIDTLLFARGLALTDLSNVKRAVEFGSGSGFLGKYLLDHAPNIEEMTLIDINPNAKKSWDKNINDPRIKPFIGNARQIIGGQFDLVIANPPYVPRPDSSDDNPYEGLMMYSHLFEYYDTLVAPAGKMLINISSLSEQEVHTWMKEQGLTADARLSLEVPLKVCNILNNPRWITYLKEHGMKEELRQGYPFWQRITIADIHPGRL